MFFSCGWNANNKLSESQSGSFGEIEKKKPEIVGEKRKKESIQRSLFDWKL